MSSSPALLPEQTLRLVVMGVSGCGKTTMAKALAQQLDLAMVDGDDLHLPESIRKMSAGIALEDADRWPWLERIGHYLEGASGAGRVVACSALKRAYRDRIRQCADGVRFVFLQGEYGLIEARMSQRVGHYMSPGLLRSQFDTLEPPQADEPDVLSLHITDTIEALVQQVLAALQQPRAQLSLHP